MKTSDFDYVLPPERIAQTPVEPRDQSRLLVLNRAVKAIEHGRFCEIADYLRSGDVMVLNESRVIPARLLGHKVGGGAKLELLLLNRIESGVWEALVKPGRRIRSGTVIELESEKHPGSMLAEVQAKNDNGTVTVHLSNENLINGLGDVPLPPYIHTPVTDPERYQTVYAKTKGSVAAPTAGLHFTPELLNAIESKGVELLFVTLHVGLGSFRPVKTENPTEHSLHREYCEVSSDVAEKLNSAKRGGRRIVGVGTTAVRAVEWATDSNGEILPFTGWNELYILPGFQFRAIDAMITNFHLPRSTLLMLVAGFAGREFILDAYNEAVQRDYRFYSFGDAMLIL
jgi:S-adenosylmethionine:tRNA ribosyltransferase-isomerase